MNVFLRLNINVLNYFLIYVRMLLTLNLSFENESCDCHMMLRAKARLFKSCVLSFTSEKQRIFSDDKVGCRRKIVIDVECMDLHSEAA